MKKPKAKIPLVCKCGNTFLINEARLKTAKFCSYKCAATGRERSTETRKRMSESQKRIGNTPGSWWKGRTGVLDTRNHIKGEDHPFWKGGVSLIPGYRTYIQNRRRTRIRAVGGSHTLQEWESAKETFNWSCPACLKTEPEIKLTRDHVVPISWGGTDSIDNIQPLCVSCNCRKYNKTISYVI